jgi:hypothetical protein
MNASGKLRASLKESMAKEIYLVPPDGKEILLFSNPDPGDIEELRMWCCYAKPIGHSVRIRVQEDSGARLCVTAAGTKLESFEDEYAEGGDVAEELIP